MWSRISIVLGIVLFGLAALFALLPTPAQNFDIAGTTVPFFCGSGSSSDPSIIVYFDPGITAGGQSSSPNESQSAQQADQALTQLGEGDCKAAATSRLIWTLVFFVLGLALAVFGPRGIRFVVEGDGPDETNHPSRTASIPAGWYPHPNGDPSTELFWDGQQWIDGPRNRHGTR
jgi:hypothetical protein